MRILDKKPDEEVFGRLPDLIGKEETEILARNLSDFFISIPRQYDVYIEIGKSPTKLESTNITNSFSIVVLEKGDSIPGLKKNDLSSLLINMKSERRGYFKFSISGYCSNNMENPTVRRALSNIKIAFQQAISKSLFTIEKKTPAGLGLLFGAPYSVQKIHLTCVDITSNSTRSVNIELPLDLCRLLENIEPNISSKPWQAATGRETEMLKAYFRLPSLLMMSNEPEAARVKSAMEWCFDSYATENTTLSFLQTCFGLEALFGEESGSENLTKTLADRCAYLTGTNIKGRKTIRDNFKSLYEIRSKIVHGSATSLGSNETHYLSWGRNVLEVSILKEVKHLDLDNG